MAPPPRWYLMCGLVGAGKSTAAGMIAASSGVVVLNRDDLMIRAVGAGYDDPVYAERLPEVTEFLWGIAAQVSAAGVDVALDWNHWSRARRAESAERARAAGAVPVVQWVRVPVEEAVRRAAERDPGGDRRGHVVGAEGVRHSAEIFEEPTPDEGIETVVVQLPSRGGGPPDEASRAGHSWAALTGVDEAAMRRFLHAATQRAESPPASPVARGRVKFFKADKGWGGIESDETPGDVWVHFSVIERAEGDYKSLDAGQQVEFAYERADQDSWRYRAVWVRPVS